MKLDLAELEEYCLSYRPQMFVYSSDFQPNQYGAQQYELYFTDIIIRRFTNRVGFRNGDSIVCFNRVKYVQLVHDNDAGITRLEVFCETQDSKLKCHVIVMPDNIF